MAAIFAFTCSRCAEVHEGSPSFGFDAPDHYNDLSDADKASMATLSSELCTITDGETTDRFVRAVIEVPIQGVEEPFLWGVWVSLSEKSYARYLETADDPVAGEAFFGWVCNRIAVYPWSQPRPANVVVQPRGERPLVMLHARDTPDDPLAQDQAQGISIARAQQLAERVLHGG